MTLWKETISRRRFWVTGRPVVEPPPPTFSEMSVMTFDESLAKVQAAGGKVMRPRMPVPGVGWMAYRVDTEGNPFWLMQDDPQAC